MALNSLPPALQGLAAFRQFICYRTGRNDDTGKLIKQPCNHEGVVINAHDAAYWMPFEWAASYAQQLGDNYGVGFVLTATDPYFFLDIDNAYVNGAWSDLATTLSAALAGCAVEVSRSHTGLHIIGRGTMPAGHRNKNIALGIELYTQERFIALTGTGATGNVDHEITPALAEWLTTHYFKPKDYHGSEDWKTEPSPEWRGSKDDEELLRRARQAVSTRGAFTGKASFADLWDANADVLARAYPSGGDDAFDRSSADMALAAHLAFWTGRDCKRIKRLMQRSALARSKWDDRPDYLDDTILEAVRLTREVCQDKQAVAGWTGNGAEVHIDGVAISTRAPLPHTTLSGRPKRVAENFAEVFRRCGITIRYDVIGKRVDVLIPGQGWHADKAGVAQLAYLESLCGHFGLPADGLDRFVTLIALQNLYNPVLTWIESKPWDGVSRLPHLYATLAPSTDRRLPDGRPLRDVLIQRWLLSAVAAACSPDGHAAQGMLVILGAQGIGKSRWVNALVPEELGLIRGGALLRPDDRDSVMAALRFWLVEISELDGTLRRSDIAQLKAFLTSDTDVVRLPYERAESRFGRRTIFISTINHEAFLSDETGARRFWTLPVSRVNADHNIDMQQLWAEIYAMWKSGEPPYLLPDELAALNVANEDHEIPDPLEDRIRTRLNWQADKSQWRWITATAALEAAGHINPRRADVTRAGVVLERLGAPSKKSNGARLRLVPPEVSAFPAYGVQQ